MLCCVFSFRNKKSESSNHRLSPESEPFITAKQLFFVVHFFCQSNQEDGSRHFFIYHDVNDQHVNNTHDYSADNEQADDDVNVDHFE